MEKELSKLDQQLIDSITGCSEQCERQIVRFEILSKTKDKNFDFFVYKVIEIETGDIYLLDESSVVHGEVGDILELLFRKI